MYLCEHDDESFEEIDIDSPIDGICFWVMTEFNLNHQTVKRRLQNKAEPFDPDSFATHPEAMESAQRYAMEIQKVFHGSSIKSIEPEMREDEFHLYIVDRTNIPIAKIGIVAEDYRGSTLH